MNKHILVCPPDLSLLARLEERVVVINTGDLGAISSICKEKTSVNLHAIKVQIKESLCSIDFQEEWMDLPLAIYSPEFGNFKDILGHLELIRNLNIRLFLSSGYEANYVGLKILSSLNISCGLYFDGEPACWEALNDLMHYTVYSMTAHAPVEPFNWLVSNYEPTGYSDYNIVFFNSPGKYLHMNEREEIAINEKDLADNKFIAQGIEALDTIMENENYIKSNHSRYEIMLQMNECAFCPGFRICLAKFPELTHKKEKCQTFFSDFMDAADYTYSKKRTKQKQLWQL